MLCTDLLKIAENGKKWHKMAKRRFSASLLVLHSLQRDESARPHPRCWWGRGMRSSNFPILIQWDPLWHGSESNPNSDQRLLPHHVQETFNLPLSTGITLRFNLIPTYKKCFSF